VLKLFEFIVFVFVCTFDAHELLMSCYLYKLH